MANKKERVAPAIFRIAGKDIGKTEFRTKVVGMTFVPNSEKLLKYLKFHVNPEDIILIPVRDAENQYDANAVKVAVTVKGSDKKYFIGHFPRDVAVNVSYALDNPNTYSVEMGKVIMVGGTEDKPNIGIMFDYRIHCIGDVEDTATMNIPNTDTDADLDAIFNS